MPRVRKRYFVPLDESGKPTGKSVNKRNYRRAQQRKKKREGFRMGDSEHHYWDPSREFKTKFSDVPICTGCYVYVNPKTKEESTFIDPEDPL